MKSEERKIYVELASEIDWMLCGFCKHYHSLGSLCSDEGADCEHPLEVISDINHLLDMSVGDDCWGFKPAATIRDTADIVGLILANNFDSGETQWWRENRQIYVQGKVLVPTTERNVSEVKGERN